MHPLITSTLKRLSPNASLNHQTLRRHFSVLNGAILIFNAQVRHTRKWQRPLQRSQLLFGYVTQRLALYAIHALPSNVNLEYDPAVVHKNLQHRRNAQRVEPLVVKDQAQLVRAGAAVSRQRFRNYREPQAQFLEFVKIEGFGFVHDHLLGNPNSGVFEGNLQVGR